MFSIMNIQIIIPDSQKKLFILKPHHPKFTTKIVILSYVEDIPTCLEVK